MVTAAKLIGKSEDQPTDCGILQDESDTSFLLSVTVTVSFMEDYLKKNKMLHDKYWLEKENNNLQMKIGFYTENVEAWLNFIEFCFIFRNHIYVFGIRFRSIILVEVKRNVVLVVVKEILLVIMAVGLVLIVLIIVVVVVVVGVLK